MGEKSDSVLPVSYGSQQPRRRTNETSTRAILACIAVVLVYGIWTIGPFMACHRHAQSQAVIPAAHTAPSFGSDARVPLEIHIMSKCPDAQVCLRDLIVPAMEDIADKVDFRISYIGEPVADHDVECKHGPEECLGNIVEMCAAELYPDPKIYLGFTMCLTNDLDHIPEQSFVKECALEHGVDFAKINECASNNNGQDGADKLRDSFKRSADAGVTKSCTVRLSDEIRCIRDGGEWKDCAAGSTPKDLIRDVTAAAS